MRILHLISGLKGGGAEHFVLELCRQSKKIPGNEMSVLTLGAVDEISNKFREADIGLVSISSPDSSKSVKAFQAFRFLKTQPHDIFHAHMFHACVIACFTKLFRPSMKIVFTLHNDHVPQLHRQVILFLTRSLRKTDVIFPGMKRRWFQKKKTAIIPNGIDIHRFQIQGEKPPVFNFAFAGRLQNEKNPLFLVDLAKSIRDKQFMISVAGDGPLKRSLEEKIASENLQSYFRLHGHVDDIAEFLNNSHCLLLPSKWEGMPLILLEAAAAGVPIITTPVGVISSLVTKNEGLIGKLKDFRSMAEEVMNNYAEAVARASKLKEKIISQYGIDRIYSMHIELYSH